MKTHTLTATVWLYPGDVAAWHFVTLPKKIGVEIKNSYTKPHHGWGSIRVSAKIGTTVWNTSLFRDTSSGSYVLPLKAGVRRKESIYAGDKISVTLTICQ